MSTILDGDGETPEIQPRRRSLLQRILLLLPAVAFIGLLAYGLMKSAPSPVAEGAELPDFELTALDGGTLTRDDILGNPVVINVWASWCTPCREEARLLEKTWREFEDEGVVFLGVNIRDAESDAKAFVEEFDISYPVLRDPNEELAGPLGVYGMPETFFIDHEGRFAGTVAGERLGEGQGNTAVLGAISARDLRAGIIELLDRAAN